MRTEIRSPHVSVASGTPTVIEIEVANTADVIDGVTAIVEGLDPAWIHLPMPVLSLFPEATGTYPIHVRLPGDVAAGEYLLNVRVVSSIDATRFSEHDLWLTVEPVEAATLTLRPSTIIGGKRAQFEASVANTGNVQTQFELTALDETRALACSTEPLSVTVPPGQESTATVHASGRRPWFGQSVSRTIHVTAASPTTELQQVATFTQKPRIPRGVLTIAILATIVALWATIFLVVINLLRGENAPTKTVAKNFNSGGAQTVPLVDVAGSALGTVTADATGQGLPRITVEAYRVRPKDPIELAASAATGDDGTYTLATLLPGSYKFRFTAEGFDELWYPTAADAGAAEVVPIQPTAKAENLDVALTGKNGGIVGTIVAPDSTSGPPPATITITRQLEQSAAVPDVTADTGAAPAPPPPTPEPPKPEPLVIQATGPFRADGLLTPATYHIRVDSQGFQSQEFDETLAGGEIKVLNTVTLGAATGSVAGQLLSVGGTPLGNVAVEARSGDIVKKATTPTAGNIGSFVIDGLQTPRTYVLTFTLEGFGSQTVAIDLTAGENRGGLNIVLLGGKATVGGTVTDAAGSPLGGVVVTVERGTFTASTATLTTASAAAAVGGYSVADIPAPGTYTVTFAKPGFISETRLVGILAPGFQPDVSAVLLPAQSSITGTVTGAGVPLASASVELSDGKTTRTTSSASSPAGAYGFANIEPGAYTLTVQRPGYATQVVIVRFTAGVDVSRPVDLPRAG